MLNPVTLAITVTVRVPGRWWPIINQALSAQHAIPFKSGAASFHTDTQRCDVRALYDCELVRRRPALRHWLLLVRLELPVEFTGEYIFISCPPPA